MLHRLLMPVDRLRQWMTIQAAFWSPALLALPWMFSAYGWTGWLLVAFVGAVAGSHAALWFVLGAGRRVADHVTLGRSVGLLTIAAVSCHRGVVDWISWSLCLLFVCADLLDGYCARRFGGSAAGAVLDMESDQVATLLLAVLMHTVWDVGAWVLLLPGYRYAFVLLALAMRWPVHDPKPCAGDNRRAKYACAAMMGLSLVGIMPALPAAVRVGCAAAAVGLLTYSYGSDVVFLLRRRSLA
jgi:phosphatidylglycerophosphate synthase